MTVPFGVPSRPPSKEEIRRIVREEIRDAIADLLGGLGDSMLKRWLPSTDDNVTPSQPNASQP